MLPHEVPDNVVYDVVIDGFLVKENKLKVRLLWDLDNKARTRFQKTINDAAPFFDNPEFHIAIEKSLQKQYEKLGGELALQIAETLHKVRSTHDLHDCLVCHRLKTEKQEINIELKQLISSVFSNCIM